MNIELAKRVRSLIRQHPERFNMSTWSSDENHTPLTNCGTSACIAGWVAAVRGRTIKDIWDSGESVSLFAEKELGLDRDVADELFHTYDNDEALERFDELIAEAEAGA